MTTITPWHEKTRKRSPRLSQSMTQCAQKPTSRPTSTSIGITLVYCMTPKHAKYMRQENKKTLIL